MFELKLNIQTIKEEFSNNKHYIQKSFFIAFFSVLPQFLIISKINHFSTLFFTIILLILLSKISKFLFFLFVIYINITNIILVHIKIHWGGSFADRLGVALESPLYETKEYLSIYITWQDYLIIAYSILLIILTIRFILSFSYNHLYKNIKIFLSLVIFLLLIKHEPFNMVNKYFKVKDRANLVYQRNENLRKEHLINVTNPVQFYDKIIIIQGESANKHHLSLYGYSIKTTPFLDELFQNKQIYKFNVIAPSNQTRYSVPMIFSPANVSHWKQNFVNNHSIITDFKINGYNTYWISNQGKVGKHEDYVTSIAEEVNNTIFFNKGSYSSAKSDIVIKNYLDEKNKNSKKEFYVFHLIGSHGNYNKRYLKDKVIFKIPKSIIEEYDNSIYFTDYILQNIFNYFNNNMKVLIVYLSDHGEVVNVKKNGHGFLPPFKDEYDIPMIIFSNVKNKRIEELQKLNKKAFNMENMNYIIKYITYLSDDLNISYSTKIFSVEPKHQFDYNNIDYFSE